MSKTDAIVKAINGLITFLQDHTHPENLHNINRLESIRHDLENEVSLAEEIEWEQRMGDDL